jgi:segregation and condensation protein A
MDRDIFETVIDFTERKNSQKSPDVSIDQLLHAFADVLARADMYAHHMIHREALSVRERMTIVLDRIKADEYVDFIALFTVDEGKAGVIVSLLAIFELIKESLIDMVQNDVNGPIYLKAAS